MAARLDGRLPSSSAPARARRLGDRQGDRGALRTGGSEGLCLRCESRRGEETVSLIRSEGGVAEAFAADVADGAQVEALVAACIDRFGSVDVLQNSVGVVALGGARSWPRSSGIAVTRSTCAASS